MQLQRTLEHGQTLKISVKTVFKYSSTKTYHYVKQQKSVVLSDQQRCAVRAFGH